MARPNKKMTKRKETEEALLLALQLSGNEAQYYKDQVDEYMQFYDNLTLINKELNKYKENIDDTDEYTKLSKEKRLISKEMRSILAFLHITPDGDTYVPEDEDL